jgi:putative transposase
MKRGRFTEEQIIAVLREAESGTQVKELCRRAGVSTGPRASLIGANAKQFDRDKPTGRGPVTARDT